MKNVVNVDSQIQDNYPSTRYTSLEHTGKIGLKHDKFVLNLDGADLAKIENGKLTMGAAEVSISGGELYLKDNVTPATKLADLVGGESTGGFTTAIQVVGTLNQNSGLVELSTTNSISEGTFEYYWTGPNDYVGIDAVVYAVEPGMYTVTVTHVETGNTAIDSTEVINYWLPYVTGTLTNGTPTAEELNGAIGSLDSLIGATYGYPCLVMDGTDMYLVGKAHSSHGGGVYYLQMTAAV
jgi:hypothetical protein